MKNYRNKFIPKNKSGFTIVELLVIVLVIGVLLTILFLTYSGIQVRQRNSTRISDTKLIQANLETYYAQSGFYPSLANMNSAKWTKSNFRTLDPATLQDPSAKPNTARFVSTPTVRYYSYQPTASDGVTACDNKTVICAKYTITATLEGNSGSFSEHSLN